MNGDWGTCPTCGPHATEPHPYRLGVTRCSNCKEWLQFYTVASERRCDCGYPPGSFACRIRHIHLNTGDAKASRD